MSINKLIFDSYTIEVIYLSRQHYRWGSLDNHHTDFKGKMGFGHAAKGDKK